MTRTLILGAILLAAATSAPAQSTRARSVVYGSVVYGPGTSSCGNWLATRQSTATMRVLYEGWILGFVSGVGTVPGQQLAETDSDAIIAWVVQHCQAQPLDSVAQAVQALTIELARRAPR